MRKLPEIEFYKLLGSGSGEGFTPIPNFGVYAILAVWPNLDQARCQVEGNTIFEAYRKRSVEAANIYLKPYNVRGKWDGKNPFEVTRDENPGPAPEPIGVITRATIKSNSLFSFWKNAPAISKETVNDDIIFKIGIGEVPWFHQVTFSIWTDKSAMMRFAYANGTCHGRAAKDAINKKWFSEELFARFSVVGTNGSWNRKSLDHLRTLNLQNPAPTQEFVEPIH